MDYRDTDLFTDINQEKINELLCIHKEVYYNYINRLELEIKLKRGLKMFYDKFINERNIEQYYFLNMEDLIETMYETL